MFSDYQGGPQGVKASQTDLLPTFNPVMFEGAVFDFTAPALNLNRPLPKPSPEPTSYPSSLSIERTSFVQNANTPNSEPRADRAPTPSLESFKEERSTDDDEEWEDTDES
jgi:hypothetical protein